MDGGEFSYLKRPDGQKLAYTRRRGHGPGLVWLSGFKSDMSGTKASAIDAWAAARGNAFLRFDYFGHGASSGDFAEGTVGRWAEDALAALDMLTSGPQILIGSSMGGWISLLTALKRPEKVHGLVLIAPAPDFTEELLWPELPDEVKREILDKGVTMRPSAYDDGPYPITRTLIEEGRAHLLLGKPIDLVCPVHILQGMADEAVPWQHALRLVEQLRSRDVVAEFVKTGDHRLSCEADIIRLKAAISAMIEKVTGN